MYGLEAKRKGFEFDLEKKLKSDPKKAKKMIEHTDQMMQEIKTTLKKGEKTKDFEKLGTLLHGYSALQKVIQKIVKT